MDVGVMGKRRLFPPGQKGLSITVSLMAATEAGGKRRGHFSQRETGLQIGGQEILPKLHIKRM